MSAVPNVTGRPWCPLDLFACPPGLLAVAALIRRVHGLKTGEGPVKPRGSIEVCLSDHGHACVDGDGSRLGVNAPGGVDAERDTSRHIGQLRRYTTWTMKAASGTPRCVGLQVIRGLWCGARQAGRSVRTEGRRRDHTRRGPGTPPGLEAATAVKTPKGLRGDLATTRFTHFGPRQASTPETAGRFLVLVLGRLFR